MDVVANDLQFSQHSGHGDCTNAHVAWWRMLCMRSVVKVPRVEANKAAVHLNEEQVCVTLLQLDNQGRQLAA